MIGRLWRAFLEDRPFRCALGWHRRWVPSDRFCWRCTTPLG